MLVLLLVDCAPLLAQPGQESEGFVRSAHTDFLYYQDRKFSQDIYVDALQEQKVTLSLQAYLHRSPQDSILVYRHTSAQKLKKGINQVVLPFQESAGNYYILPAFAAVIRKTDLVPVGSYSLVLTIRKDTTTYTRKFLHEQDSSLAPASKLRKGINDLLDPVSRSFLSVPRPVSPSLDKVSRAVERSGPRLRRYFKNKGLTPRQYQRDGKEIIEVYADEWFMGCYTLNSNASVSEELKKERAALEDNIGSMASNGLGDYTSLLSQFRELKKSSKENKELVAELSLASNFSNDQEQYAAQDNEYYEARGSLQLPIFDIPVNVTGFYTTQDKHREAKASFVHFRYDVDKAKEQLLKLVGSYNKRYEQTLSQGASYDMVYGQFVQQLQQQKDQALASLRQQADLPADFSGIGEDELKAAVLRKVEEQKSKLTDSAQQVIRGTGAAGVVEDKAARALQAKQKAEALYTRAQEQYRRIQALEQKIRKYQALLEQYRNTVHYDSLLAYDKLKDLGRMDAGTYKDIAKKAAGILPEGKAKGLIAGLTNFDAGMFPKYVSDYTMSGQMLKGVDAGYDIGFAEIGGSYGKTEYIDRDGHVEGYNAYSGRIRLKPVLNQKLGLVYYAYAPGKKLLSDDNFFKDVPASLPSFRNPVHIVSATYSGKLSSFLEATGEWAMSGKPGQSEEARSNVGFLDRSAYNLKLEGTIPATAIDVEAGYEHAGKAFENNTLPVIMAGTDRIRTAVKGDFFRGFFSLGIEYNYLIQNSLYSRGNNSKWGFQVATHSRRYPSVSLSYKPFSTFRSYNDTLSIAQKPIMGEVWTGKLSYQIRKPNRAIRFTLLYNRNTSTADTLKYGSSLVQLNTILTHKASMLSLNLGYSQINTDAIPVAYPAFKDSKFINIAAGNTFFEDLMLSGGVDLAASRSFLSRYGIFISGGYQFRKLPVMIRANFRYNNYKMDEAAGWKQLCSAGIELAWRLRFKLFDN